MIKSIVFDFDGVIADTYKMYLAMYRKQFPKLSKKEFDDFHEGNIYERSLKLGNSKVFLDAGFHRKKVINFSKQHVFPVKKVITELAKNHKLFIISSSSERNINAYLKSNNLKKHFKKIYGLESDKSKSTKFKIMCAENNFKTEECIFIADTAGDIKEIKPLKIKTIAVTWGYHNIARIKKAKPDYIVNKSKDIIKVVEKIV